MNRKSLSKTLSRTHRAKEPKRKLLFGSRSFAPARSKGAARWVSIPPIRYAHISPEKAQALQQPLPLPPQPRQRRLEGVMPTPRLTSSESDRINNRDDLQRKPRASTYYGECVCGQHFEISLPGWIGADCHHHICDRVVSVFSYRG
jgi:hypothetical protein